MNDEFIVHRSAFIDSLKALALRPRITPGVPLSVISKQPSKYAASLICSACFVNNYDLNRIDPFGTDFLPQNDRRSSVKFSGSAMCVSTLGRALRDDSSYNAVAQCCISRPRAGVGNSHIHIDEKVTQTR